MDQSFFNVNNGDSTENENKREMSSNSGGSHGQLEQNSTSEVRTSPIPSATCMSNALISCTCGRHSQPQPQPQPQFQQQKQKQNSADTATAATAIVETDSTTTSTTTSQTPPASYLNAPSKRYRLSGTCDCLTCKQKEVAKFTPRIPRYLDDPKENRTNVSIVLNSYQGETITLLEAGRHAYVFPRSRLSFLKRRLKTKCRSFKSRFNKHEVAYRLKRRVKWQVKSLEKKVVTMAKCRKDRSGLGNRQFIDEDDGDGEVDVYADDDDDDGDDGGDTNKDDDNSNDDDDDSNDDNQRIELLQV